MEAAAYITAGWSDSLINLTSMSSWSRRSLVSACKLLTHSVSGKKWKACPNNVVLSQPHTGAFHNNQQSCRCWRGLLITSFSAHGLYWRPHPAADWWVSLWEHAHRQTLLRWTSQWWNVLVSTASFASPKNQKFTAVRVQSSRPHTLPPVWLEVK